MTYQPPRARGTSDEQIDRIVRLMTEGKWAGGKSISELAAEWNCSPQHVHVQAKCASAVLRRAGGDLADFIAAKMAELERLAVVALEGERPNVMAAVKTIELQLQVKGALARQGKPAAPESETPNDVARMSRAEKIAAHEAAIAELRAEQEKDGMH